MAAVGSRPRHSRESRQQALLQKLKATAQEMGFVEVASGSEEAQLTTRGVLTFGNDRRLYLSPLRGTEAIHLHVGDGGGGELRYDSDTRKWQALFGGVPVLRDVENELAQLLTLLMGS